MRKSEFSQIDTWVFDLDNTLYPPSIRLFDQIEQRMTDYVSKILNVSRHEADALRSAYWKSHGTTLAGLMENHGIDPEPYLLDVHDISFDALAPDDELAEFLAALPGRKFVYTNGTAPYATRVLEARALTTCFDGVFGVEHAGYRPKPERDAFESVFELAGVNPVNSVMFEDEERNLAAPHEMGMRTVHVSPIKITARHIDHHARDLTVFLSHLI